MAACPLHTHRILRSLLPLGAVLALLTPSFAPLVAQEDPARPPGQRPRRGDRGGGLTERFDQIDKNKDGKVTPDELDNPAMFLWLDRDGDGVITRREASEVITELGANRRWARPDPSATPVPPAEPPREAPTPVPPAAVGVGRRLPDLTVPDLDGRKIQLGSKPAGKARVLIVTSSTCPVSRKYAPLIGRLHQEWSPRDVEFIHIAPLDSDSADSLRTLAANAKWSGPLLQDPNGLLTAALALRTTSEVIVADSANTVVYRGAIDDQYGLGYSRAEARTHPLRDTLEALVAGRSPAWSATTAPGCVLETPSTHSLTSTQTDKSLTWHGRVSRIFQLHCTECHHADGPAPFALDTLPDVLSHAGMIRRQVERGAMPPWFATPPEDGSHSPFINDRTLPAADRSDLLAWLNGDRAPGDVALAPLPRTYPTEWQIGTPDVVYTLPKPVAIPADGVMPYQNIFVETGLTNERWVSAIEIQPTARAAVHHVLVFALPPGERRGRRGDDSSSEEVGFFAAYVPGNTYRIFPKDFAKPIPAGATLRFQIHYTPFGVATNDQLRMGMVFTPTPPRYRVHVAQLANPGLQIPPGAAHHPEHASLPVPRDARILSLMPHMHVRGSAFRYEMVAPDGSSQTLLDIPHYDFNWQLSYRYADPLFAPKGSRLRATAWYDNSTGNPANPDPTRTVKWGPQTYDEMMLGYLEYYLPDQIARQP